MSLYTRRLLDRCPTANEAEQLLASLCKHPFAFTPPNVDGPLALYGAGNMGRMARD